MSPKERKTIIDDHPDHEDLACVAEGNVSEWLRANVLRHVESCEKCRFILMELARYADDIAEISLPEGNNEPLKLAVIEQQDKEQHEEVSDTPTRRPWRRPGDTFYFWIAGSFFFISLLFTTYNKQFLIATAFFGLLAVVDYSHRNIFSPLIAAWREGDDEKAEEVIEELKKRFKVG